MRFISVKCVLIGRMTGGWCSRRMAGKRISSVVGVRERLRTIGLFVLRSTVGNVGTVLLHENIFPTAPFLLAVGKCDLNCLANEWSERSASGVTRGGGLGLWRVGCELDVGMGAGLDSGWFDI